MPRTPNKALEFSFDQLRIWFGEIEKECTKRKHVVGEHNKRPSNVDKGTNQSPHSHKTKSTKKEEFPVVDIQSSLLSKFKLETKKFSNSYIRLKRLIHGTKTQTIYKTHKQIHLK